MEMKCSRRDARAYLSRQGAGLEHRSAAYIWDHQITALYAAALTTISTTVNELNNIYIYIFFKKTGLGIHTADR
jgi:hypothetical protein